MRNRITHLLQDWNPEQPAAAPSSPGEPAVRQNPTPGPHQMPRGINMLMPIELCVNRNLLVSLLSASILEIKRHQRLGSSGLSGPHMSEVEAALQQQLTFRAWLKDHPSNYVCIALYPLSEAGTVDDLEDQGDLPS